MNKENVKQIAVSKEQRRVQVPLETDSLEEIKESYIEKSKQLKQLLDEKALSMNSFKERINPLQKEVNEAIDLLKDGYMETNAMCFLIPNIEENIMEYYLEDGTLVFSRPLRPDEKQFSILSIEKEG